jgi:hypothetical protein
LALFDAVYGEASAGEGSLRLRLAAPDPLRGDALIQRMTEAARAADPAVGRSRLYAAMLDAELLLLVEEDGAPTQVGELSGWPVYAAFTDHDALRRQDARAPQHRRQPKHRQRRSPGLMTWTTIFRSESCTRFEVDMLG